VAAVAAAEGAEAVAAVAAAAEAAAAVEAAGQIHTNTTRHACPHRTCTCKLAFDIEIAEGVLF
jgi:hypothetical protein